MAIVQQPDGSMKAESDPPLYEGHNVTPETRKSCVCINVGADYTEEQVEFLVALDRFKRAGHPHPTDAEILRLAWAMGYRKEVNAVEAAAFLGVTRMTIYNWCKSGKLRAIRSAQGWIIEATSLEGLARDSRGRPSQPNTTR